MGLNKAKMAVAIVIPILLVACSSPGSSTPVATTAPGGTTAPAGTTAPVGGAPLTADQLRGKKLVINSWGGVWTETTKAMADVFGQQFGVTIEYPTSPNPGAQAHLEVQSGAVQMDVIDSAAYTNQVAGDLEQFPQYLVDTLTANIPAECVSQYFVGCYGDTATAIGCNTALVAKCPTNAKEFWDVANFPGPRAIAGTTSPDAQLIFALFATGVAKDAIYPIDIDKAIASLKVIKPNIAVWPTSGGQMQQVLVDKEVAIEFGWNGRLFNAKKEVPTIEIYWENSTVAGGKQAGLAVAKGAPNKDVAFTFLNWWVQQAELQAAWTKALTYPTPNTKVADLLPPEILAGLPYSPTHPQPLLVDAQFTSDNQDKLQKAFQEFLTGS